MAKIKLTLEVIVDMPSFIDPKLLKGGLGIGMKSKKLRLLALSPTGDGEVIPVEVQDPIRVSKTAPVIPLDDPNS